MKGLSLVIVAFALAVVTSGCGQSDSVTNRNVKAKLLDASQQTRQVFVMTRDGVVTLSGTVESEKAKQLAVRLTRETQGVSDVIDLIEVDAPAPTAGVRNRGHDEAPARR